MAGWWRGIGLWRLPKPIEDDEGGGAYRGRSIIESALVVLRKRDDCRGVADADRVGDVEAADGVAGVMATVTEAAVLVPAPGSCVPDIATAGDDLEPRNEAPPPLVRPAAGTAGLISCSALAGPGVLACLGSGCGLEGGAS